MNQNYIKANEWSIIEEGFDTQRVKASESLFSLGNGAMGQRANFEETYSGDTFQGSYIAGVYYPDKTKVGWWKIGYPEYFAKVLNAPNWIGIDVVVDGELLDLARCASIESFRQELNMREGWYERSFEACLQNGVKVRVVSRRFLCLDLDEVGAICYSVTPINRKANIALIPYLDSDIVNHDANWNDKFWETLSHFEIKNRAFILARTRKTHFTVATFMHNEVSLNGISLEIPPVKKSENTQTCIRQTYSYSVEKEHTLTLTKLGGYLSSLNHEVEDLDQEVEKVLNQASLQGYEGLLVMQKKAWEKIWDRADIMIHGDVYAQQGIRFNIFQLNQTYLGKDDRLNIGPKGFTGEKYGGSTYWDTEAYCLPFYMATKGREVGRSLLKYRYNQLGKAIENARKLGFENGAALYPMVTMDGEEGHNEWEITFEEIHRNGAIVYAIFNYVRFTGDYSYIPEMGLEVMIGVARFWHQRAHLSPEKNQYVILGVTGPNEYENNVNNNWYTNYIAKWCIDYCIENIGKVKNEFPEEYRRISEKTILADDEINRWRCVADNLYFPQSEKHGIFLQQDGFLDKESLTIADIPSEQSPINQHWSWDRILRSPYIKQADVLQGFYFFEDHFSLVELERNFDFYEPITVHESSLSPCIHCILAASLDRKYKAYELYLRTSRLDLDDYNKEVHQGLHITSMAGTWMSIVEGFGGMRVRNGVLSFTPRIPDQWHSYSFKVIFRGYIITLEVRKNGIDVYSNESLPFQVLVHGKEEEVKSVLVVKGKFECT